jgi:L-rhamnose-H+ transport protein
MEVFTGILYHAFGASNAALCYTPQKKVFGWSWQSYWLAQASVCWLLLPVIIAYITIPNLHQVLSEAPREAMWKAFGLGFAYGIGGTAFGLAIRYAGFSLTYAISVGISCVLGTLLPPLVRDEINALLQQNGFEWIIGGIVLGIIGIALCGIAGRCKESDLKNNESSNTSFSLAKGLPLCLLAGILSAVYGFAIDQGHPIAEVAARHGAGNFQVNVIYIFSNSGAFLFTLLYCTYLHLKYKTFGEFRQIAAGGNGTRLRVNFAMAGLTGFLWYAQFFFYGLGHIHMGDYRFSSWAIHMIMLVLFSSLAGLAMNEWSCCNKRTLQLLSFALIVLIISVLTLTYGNYLGNLISS